MPWLYNRWIVEGKRGEWRIVDRTDRDRVLLNATLPTKREAEKHARAANKRASPIRVTQRLQG